MQQHENPHKREEGDIIYSIYPAWYKREEEVRTSASFGRTDMNTWDEWEGRKVPEYQYMRQQRSLRMMPFLRIRKKGKSSEIEWLIGTEPTLLRKMKRTPAIHFIHTSFGALFRVPLLYLIEWIYHSKSQPPTIFSRNWDCSPQDVFNCTPDSVLSVWEDCWK